LDQPPNSAHYFYRIVTGSTFVGVQIDFANINPVKALFCTAVVNGLLASLLVGILIAASDHKIMNGQTSLILSRAVVAATLVMFRARLVCLCSRGEAGIERFHMMELPKRR
jgi:hypothetical protein